jgi:hypothetical protein
MSRADSGGFDLGFHVSLGAVQRLLAPIVATPIPDVHTAVNGWGTLTFHQAVTLGPMTILPDHGIQASLTASASLSWPALVSAGITLAPAGTANYGMTATIVARPAANGNRLRLEFPAGSATVRLAPGTLESIPGIQAWLALVQLLAGTAALEAERARLYHDAESGLSAALDGALADVVPIGTLPSPPVNGVVIDHRADELRVLMTIGGTPGNPSAITRSPIRRGAHGLRLDLAGIVVGNRCILHDVLRPVLSAGLGLPLNEFDGDHPCRWRGTHALPAAATVAGIRPTIRAVRAGIDTAGTIRVRLRFDGAHGSGGFGLTGAINLGFRASVEQDGDRRLLRLTLDTSVVEELDIWVAWWVYAGGILLLPLLTLAVALVDAFGGGALARTINDAVRGALGTGTLELPLPAGGVGLTRLSTAQPDAEAQVFPGPGGAPVIDFPANDVIVSIG